MKFSQATLVLDHLNVHGSITAWDAISNYRITRLAEMIRILKAEGFEIESHWEHGNGKRWVRYLLIKADQGALVGNVA